MAGIGRQSCEREVRAIKWQLIIAAIAAQQTKTSIACSLPFTACSAKPLNACETHFHTYSPLGLSNNNNNTAIERQKAYYNCFLYFHCFNSSDSLCLIFYAIISSQVYCQSVTGHAHSAHSTGPALGSREGLRPTQRTTIQPDYSESNNYSVSRAYRRRSEHNL